MHYKTSIALFLLGLLIISYPIIARIYYDYNNQTEVVALGQNIQGSSLGAVQKDWLAYNYSLLDNNQGIVSPPVEENHEDIQNPEENLDGVIATIKIPVLDIHYPIYDKATPENLNRGVARVEGTSFPTGGKSTNSVLAAHSRHPYHEWFTNVDKLRSGDEIIVNNFLETLHYRVYHMEVINPDQVDRLSILENKDILTLITCTDGGKRRILVYAERVEEEKGLSKSDSKYTAVPEKSVPIVYKPNLLRGLKILSDFKWIIFISIIISLIYFRHIKRNVRSQE